MNPFAMGRKQNSLRLVTAVSNPTLSASSFVIWYLQAGDTSADTHDQ
jgi:hypothetical protein